MEIKRAAERKAHFRFIVEYLRMCMDSPHLSKLSMDAVLIAAAVALGHLEGRPFRTAKLAGYLQIPRATLARRLEELEQANIICRGKGAVWLLVPETFNSDLSSRVTDRFSALVLRTAAEIAKVHGGGGGGGRYRRV